MVPGPTDDFTGLILSVGLRLSLRGASVLRKFFEFFIFDGRDFFFSFLFFFGFSILVGR